MKISDEHLRTIIANKVRESGLDGVFDGATRETIKDRLKSEYRKLMSAPVEQMLPEGDIAAPVTPMMGDFPYEDKPAEQQAAVEAPMPVAPAMEAGAEPTDVAYPPKTYTPELPDALKNMPPAQLVVMELNDIIENGENLSLKPFRSMDDIDSKQSMQDLWKSGGQTKADVHIIKFEKAGEMTFDYASGTAVFVPVSSAVPDAIDKETYKENPYKDLPELPPMQDIRILDKSELETFVKTSVDVEDIVRKVVIDLMAKAHDEKVGADAKDHMGMTPPEAPEPTPYEASNLPVTVGEQEVKIKPGIMQQANPRNSGRIYPKPVLAEEKGSDSVK